MFTATPIRPFDAILDLVETSDRDSVISTSRIGGGTPGGTSISQSHRHGVDYCRVTRPRGREAWRETPSLKQSAASGTPMSIHLNGVGREKR
jgi:hypothetical protein